MAKFALTELIGDTRRRRRGRVSRRQRITSLVLASGFMATAVPMAVVGWTRPLSISSAAVLVVAYAVASLVEFEVGTGVAVPTQMVFVPMLFLLPTEVVPLAAAAGLLLGDGIRRTLRRGTATRPSVLLTSSWYTVGPVVVLLAARHGPPEWNRWPVYVAAFASQFVIEAGITVMADVLSYGVRPSLSIRALGWAYAVDLMLVPAGIAFAVVAAHNIAAIAAVLATLGVLAWFARDRRAHIDALLDLNRTYRGTALVLGNVIEADDSYTGIHSRNVLDLSLAVAEQLGLDADTCRDVEFTALLHDVGKLRIPKDIINKPGRLTPEERSLMETHTVAGQEMLVEIGGFLSQVGSYVRSCHERYGGGGYPDGLVGQEIPIAARIVFCCDAYDAITSDRPYRRARPRAAALEELTAGAGSQFDPTVVQALVAVVTRLPAAERETTSQAVLSIPNYAALSQADPLPAVVDLVSKTVRARGHVARVRARARAAPGMAAYLVGGAFVVAAAALAGVGGGGVPSLRTLGVFAALAAGYAVVYGIDFRVGPGSAIPTQLAFIPMLVLLPPGLVPLAVAVGILLGSARDMARADPASTQHPLVLVAGGWYAVGPAAVLIAMGDPRLDWRLVTLLVLLQIVVDAIVNTLRAHVMLGFPLRSLLAPLAWAYAADLALTPIAFTAADPSAAGRVAAMLGAASLVGFLAVVAWERNRHLSRAEQLADAYQAAAAGARRDPLTGLANRLAWEEALATLPTDQPAAAIMLDMNGLKAANDSRGHALGDRLLTELAHILAGATASATTISRIGGDEFGILLTGPAAQEAESTITRLRAALDSHPGVDGLPLGAAIGTASSPPQPNIEAAIHAADLQANNQKHHLPHSRHAA